MERVFLRAVIITLFGCTLTFGQITDYLEGNLGVKFEVESNLVGDDKNYTTKVTLTNNGNEDIPANPKEWNIYFMSIFMVEPKQELWKTDNGYDIPNSGFKVYHVSGTLFMLEPNSQFDGIPAGGSTIIILIIQNWSVARTDFMPNWYVTDSSGKNNRTIRSTQTEDLIRFTGSYDTAAQWKRYEADTYDPWSAEQRWEENDVEDLGAPAKLVIPTPLVTSIQQNKPSIAIPLVGWTVMTSSEELNHIADLVRDHITGDGNGAGEIRLTIDATASTNMEGYKMVIDGDSNVTNISSPSEAGVYYGCQTLISLLKSSASEIASMTITDAPRFGFRGMHVDVGRHFILKDDLKKLIRVMGMYKLNKLHLHLTDDEGWRVEMPWCPQLTTTGATQCHDPSEEFCQYPQFGSKSDGLDRGSGSYTTEHYKEILEFAKQNYIEVIPEVDLPGHARAAIKGVQAFLKSGHNNSEAQAIQLTHENDTSQYLSVQMYTDNAVDPCLESTYEFVRKTIETFIEYHSGIQPLKVMHIGGDEVADGAWKDSPACIDKSSNGEINVTRLAEEFVFRVSEIANDLDENLTLGLWEDGAIKKEVLFDRNNITTKEVLVNSWQNIWEWGLASRAYRLANAGYKVVMSQATHLYFDHPPEPDPEERGFYWATRYSNIRKTFGFKPDDLYANMDVTRNGDPIEREELCRKHDCTPLQTDSGSNIIGMQGLVWTETMRTTEQFFDAIFPRVVALAERAWHKANWETTSDAAKEEEEEDWKNFANTLGYKELRRLEQAGVTYRVPPPGVKHYADPTPGEPPESGVAGYPSGLPNFKQAMIDITSADGSLTANVELPGLTISYSTEDNPNTWTPYTTPVKSDGAVKFRANSNDRTRTSRIISATYSSSSRIRLHPASAIIGFLVIFSLMKF